jgi:hypothetical protein
MVMAVAVIGLVFLLRVGTAGRHGASVRAGTGCAARLGLIG